MPNSFRRHVEASGVAQPKHLQILRGQRPPAQNDGLLPRQPLVHLEQLPHAVRLAHFCLENLAVFQRNTFDEREMFVGGYHRQFVGNGASGNPHIVFGNWMPIGFQLRLDFRIVWGDF